MDSEFVAALIFGGILLAFMILVEIMEYLELRKNRKRWGVEAYSDCEECKGEGAKEEYGEWGLGGWVKCFSCREEDRNRGIRRDN